MNTKMNDKKTVVRNGQPTSNGVKLCKECEAKPLEGERSPDERRGKRVCKECGKQVASGKSIKSYAARKLGYCKECYLDLFPERPMWNLPPARMGSEKILTCHEYRIAEEAGFNPSLWSDDFLWEMMDYFEARERGELLC